MFVAVVVALQPIILSIQTLTRYGVCRAQKRDSMYMLPRFCALDSHRACRCRSSGGRHQEPVRPWETSTVQNAKCKKAFSEKSGDTCHLQMVPTSHPESLGSIVPVVLEVISVTGTDGRRHTRRDTPSASTVDAPQTPLDPRAPTRIPMFHSGPDLGVGAAIIKVQQTVCAGAT